MLCRRRVATGSKTWAVPAPSDSLLFTFNLTVTSAEFMPPALTRAAGSAPPRRGTTTEESAPSKRADATPENGGGDEADRPDTADTADTADVIVGEAEGSVTFSVALRLRFDAG